VTVGEALRDATARIGVDWARDDAEMLMAHALGVSRSAMLLEHMRDPVPESFATMLERRLKHEPVAYILGEVEFYAPRKVLDCGTGSGCLLLTILAECPRAYGVGIDCSPAALAVARDNANALDLAARTDLRDADWTQSGWADGIGAFDLILANPPYVEDDAELDPSVRDHEPAGALFAGPDGLDAYRVLVPKLPALLSPQGVAAVEIGWRQAEAVSDIAAEAGFSAELRRDLADRPRAVILSRKGLAKGR